MVEESLESGNSVALVARAHGQNANLARLRVESLYREGQHEADRRWEQEQKAKV